MGVLSKETALIASLCDHNSIVVRDENIDWLRLVYLADQHRISNLLLLEQFAFVLPTEILNCLKEQVRFRHIHMLRLYRELCEVNRHLREKGVAIGVLKGPVLSYVLYGDVAKRISRDLDIVVLHNQIESVLEHLSILGYKRKYNTDITKKQKEVFRRTFHHYELYNEEKGITLEIHWNILSNLYFSRRVNEQFQFTKSQQIGTEYFRTLNTIDELLYLCLHGSHHRWKRLTWLLDVKTYLQREKDIIPAVYSRAKQLQCNYLVLDTMYMLMKCFGIVFSDSMILDDLKKHEKKLNKLYSNSLWHIDLMERESTSQKKSVLEEFITKLQHVYKNIEAEYLLGGFRLVFRRIRLVFVQPKVWRLYTFPDYLFFLNYVFVPFLNLYRQLKKRCDK